MRKVKREKKMLRVYRFHGGRKELVCKEAVDAPCDALDFFREGYDILHGALLNAGIEADKDELLPVLKTIYTRGAVQSSYDRYGASATQLGSNQAILGREDRETVYPESGYGFDIYRTGMMLSVGKRIHNILGGRENAYFAKITPKKFRCTGASYCKTGEAKDFLKILRSEEDVFRFMVAHNDYMYGIEYTCPYAEEDAQEMIAGLSGARLKKYHEDMTALQQMIDALNGTPEQDGPVQFAETPQDEALRRMKELRLYGPAITRFKKGELLMSYPGGALFDLDDVAKNLVEDVKKKELLPYHVVLGGDGSYSVLYIGPKDEWVYEAGDLKRGHVMAYVFNPAFECREYGTVTVEPANGGIVRVG